MCEYCFFEEKENTKRGIQEVSSCQCSSARLLLILGREYFNVFFPVLAVDALQHWASWRLHHLMFALPWTPRWSARALAESETRFPGLGYNDVTHVRSLHASRRRDNEQSNVRRRLLRRRVGAVCACLFKLLRKISSPTNITLVVVEGLIVKQLEHLRIQSIWKMKSKWQNKGMTSFQSLPCGKSMYVR